ncbi:MAG: phage holin family protein [Pseudomonadota bacterium]
MRLLLIWLCNALALLTVAYILPGVRVDGFGSALIAAVVLGLINTMLRPLLILLTLPVTVVTLGLFILVINGLLFWMAGSLLRGFEVGGFWVGLFGALLYSIISYVLSLLLPRH